MILFANTSAKTTKEIANAARRRQVGNLEGMVQGKNCQCEQLWAFIPLEID